MSTSSFTELTLTWARGLLEERVGDTGALALVLTALCHELERPVRQAHGRSDAARASLELDADLSRIRLRGRAATVHEAARRLPQLFTRPLIAEGLTPRGLPDPLWQEDLLARTGSSALALRGLGALGDGARDEARRLLREMDPWHGTVNCLVRAQDESLRDLLDIPAPRPAQEETTWADGTARWSPGSAPGARVIASSRSRELFSVMVPRTPDGRTAAELLRISLAEALAAADSQWTKVSLRSEGMGEGLRVVAGASPPLRDEKRPQVLTELLRRVELLPDSWIESVRRNTPWHDHGRVVRGLDEPPKGSIDGVRRALEEAVSSIHLALDPSLLDFAVHSRLTALPVAGPAVEDPEEPVRVYEVSRRGRRSGGSDPSTRVRLTRSTLTVEDDPNGPRTVGLDRLIAVLHTPTGARRLLDDAGGSVTVRTDDLEEGEQLETYLAHRLRRVPRLRLEDGAPRTHPGVHRRRQRNLLFLTTGAMAVMLLVFGVLPALDDGDDGTSTTEAWTRQTLDWDETVELSNGTRITASPPVESQDVHRVTVTFCGGADTEGLGFDGEEGDEMDQNIVRPGDFMLYTDSGAALPLVEEPEQPEDLPSDWLDDGECATGDLRFDSMGGEGSALAYRNSLGDSITWKND